MPLNLPTLAAQGRRWEPASRSQFTAMTIGDEVYIWLPIIKVTKKKKERKKTSILVKSRWRHQTCISQILINYSLLLGSSKMFGKREEVVHNNRRTFHQVIGRANQPSISTGLIQFGGLTLPTIPLEYRIVPGLTMKCCALFWMDPGFNSRVDTIFLSHLERSFIFPFLVPIKFIFKTIIRSCRQYHCATYLQQQPS